MTLKPTRPSDDDVARRVHWLDQIAVEPRSNQVIHLRPPWTTKRTRPPASRPAPAQPRRDLRLAIVLAGGGVLALALGAAATTIATAPTRPAIQCGD